MTCLAPVVQKVDSAIHPINRFPRDGAIGFPNTYMYPLDSDLSHGLRCPTFKQPGPDLTLLLMPYEEPLVTTWKYTYRDLEIAFS